MTTTNFRPKYISFDVYGTLISWDTDPTTLRLLAGRLPEEQWPTFKKVFRGYRYDEVCGDYKPYEQILQDSFDRVCKRFGIGPTPGAGAEFAEAVRSWGAHDDVPAPLKLMGENYKLVALSNADDSFLDISIPRLGADWHAVLTAEQAQAYKPRYQAFEYMMLEHLGEPVAARVLVEGIEATLAEGIRTPDLGGTASTKEVAEAVVRHGARILAAGLPSGWVLAESS